MTDHDLATLLLVIAPHLTPEDALTRVESARERVEAHAPTPKAGRPRINEHELRTRVLAFVRSHHQPPTISEIKKALKGNATRVQSAVRALESDGLLVNAHGQGSARTAFRVAGE